MFVFNNRISKATAAAILILGISIGYSIYTRGGKTAKLDTASLQTGDQSTGEINQSTQIPNNLGELLPTSTPNFIPDTLTSYVGQEIFSAYTKIKRTNGQINDQAVDQVSKAFSDAIENAPFVADFKEYTAADLAINRSPGKADWQNFASQITATVALYKAKFSNLLFNQPPSSAQAQSFFFEQLVKSGAIYKSLAADLSKISVPENALDGFIRLLNSYSLSAAGLSELKYYSSDPVRAGAGWRIHSQSAAQLELIAIDELRNALKANGIIFALTPLSS